MLFGVVFVVNLTLSLQRCECVFLATGSAVLESLLGFVYLVN